MDAKNVINIEISLLRKAAGIKIVLELTAQQGGLGSTFGTEKTQTNYPRKPRISNFKLSPELKLLCDAEKIWKNFKREFFQFLYY